MTFVPPRERRASGGVLFAGPRSLHSEGLYRLTADYAASLGVPLLHSETAGGVTSLRPVSLMVCSPPCGGGFPDWLLFLLNAGLCRAERVMVYLGEHHCRRERLAGMLFSCPSGAVCDRDSPEAVGRLLRSSPSTLRAAPSSLLSPAYTTRWSDIPIAHI